MVFFGQETEVPFAPKVLVVGRKMYSRCCTCGDIVCVNKRVLGDLHFCLTQEEIQAKRRGLWQ